MVTEVTNKTMITVQTQGKPAVVDFTSTKAEKTVETAVLKSTANVEQPADSEEMEFAANRLNEIAQDIRRDLQFKVDDNSGDMVITVLDRETNEVIRQIPQEHVLALRENMESLKGILFSAKI